NVRNLNIYHRADSRGSTAIAIAWDGTRSSAPSIANLDGVIIFTDGLVGSSTVSKGLSVGDKSVVTLRAIQFAALRDGLNMKAFDFSAGALLQDKGMNIAQGFNTPPSSVCDGKDDAITNVAVWDGRRTVYCQ
nr:hypothetical protein [Alphaproteobacteria bacterium]